MIMFQDHKLQFLAGIFACDDSLVFSTYINEDMLMNKFGVKEDQTWFPLSSC